MFNQVLDQKIANSKRYDQPFTLIICDLDHFKRVNDSHGHHVGDRVLQEFVSILRERTRSVDFISRWGGEEFTIILPNTRLSEAQHVLHSLQSKVREHCFYGAGKITVSMGMGEFSRQNNRNDFFRAFDKALYRAKQQGRDMYCVAEFPVN